MQRLAFLALEQMLLQKIQITWLPHWPVVEEQVSDEVKNFIGILVFHLVGELKWHESRVLLTSLNVNNLSHVAIMMSVK
jgi:hypothetical protein